jgi:hypothetical protein
MAEKFKTLESVCAGMFRNEFANVDDVTAMRLRKYISQCCEKSFRRGFQQGSEAAEKRRKPTVSIWEWRILLRVDQSIDPFGGRSFSAIERFDIECCPEIVGLGDRSKKTAVAQ